jgi:3',5'-cyclic-AMP phosphodiesterase
MTPDAARTIVQISDCHLFSDVEGTLLGMPTRPRLRRVMDEIEQRTPDFDLLVVTGDTAHDETGSTYDALADALGHRLERLRIVPGNHDERTSLSRLFPNACATVADRVTFLAEAAGWLLIGLDSQRPGESAGTLGEQQLEWLEAILEEKRHVDTVIFVHHPPIDVSSPWLDAIALQDADALGSVLDGHPQVKLVLTGHVHQEASGSLGHAHVLTTPAVGPQFRPHTENLEIEPGPPAYRVVELSPDGEWSTNVVRCSAA